MCGNGILSVCPANGCHADAVSTKNSLADLRGESSNHFDDLFKDLEDWETILNWLPDFGVDQNPDDREIPGPAVG